MFSVPDGAGVYFFRTIDRCHLLLPGDFMKQISACKLSVVMVSAIAAMTLALPAAAMDADAAKDFFKDKDCTKCHAPKKTKKGPSLAKIAEKYREKDKAADAEAKMYKHVTSSPKVKLEDGTEEEHKALDKKDDAQIKNVIQWILSH